VWARHVERGNQPDNEAANRMQVERSGRRAKNRDSKQKRFSGSGLPRGGLAAGRLKQNRGVVDMDGSEGRKTSRSMSNHW